MIIRRVTMDDAPALAAIYEPYVASIISFEDVAPDAGEMRARIAETTRTHPWLVAAEGSEIVGYAYAGVHRKRHAYRFTAETAAYVRRDCAGRGIGRALYGELLACLRRRGFHNAVAGITMPNGASVALHMTCGFEPAGIFKEIGYKNGGWRDTSWWQLRLALDADGPRGLIQIRSAEAGEAAALTDLAMRSKRSWGYDESFMVRVAPEMIVSEADIAAHNCLIACIDGAVAGYALLEMRGDQAWLRDLFVEPERMRSGVGNALFGEMLLDARAAGARTLRLESDPNAVAFYERMEMAIIGATVTGAGRSIPLMEMPLT